MVSVYKHELEEDAYVASVSYLRRRLRDLTERVEDLRCEIQALETLLNVVEKPLCSACDGHGKIRVLTDQDSSHLEKCEPCAGTGRSASAVGTR